METKIRVELPNEKRRGTLTLTVSMVESKLIASKIERKMIELIQEVNCEK